MTTTSGQVSGYIPEAVFLAPAERTTGLSADDLIEATVDVLCESAALGLTEAYSLVRPGKPLQDLSKRGTARLLLDLLIDHDMNKRAWMAVDWLQPELGAVVTCIRRQKAAEERLQAGHYMHALREKVASFQREDQHV